MHDFNPLLSTLLDKAKESELVPVLSAALKYMRLNPSEFRGIWHPYGFLVTNLLNVDARLNMRLHIWPDQPRLTQVPEWPIHCHDWALQSHILCGTMENEVYLVKVDPHGPKQLYWARSAVSNVSILEATGINVDCERISINKYYAGDTYHLPKNEYHATHVDHDTFAATLVLKTELASGVPYVVGDVHHADAYKYERRIGDEIEFLNLITRLLESFDP